LFISAQAKTNAVLTLHPEGVQRLVGISPPKIHPHPNEMRPAMFGLPKTPRETPPSKHGRTPSGCENNFCFYVTAGIVPCGTLTAYQATHPFGVQNQSQNKRGFGF
jgi:hypothetical protein